MGPENAVGRILCVDWGERRLGLAVSDPTRVIAQGVGAVKVESQSQAVERVCEVGRQWEAESVVVGLPLNMDGSEGEAARRARDFAAAVGSRSRLPIVTWDERLTSMQAERTLREGRRPRGGAAGRRARDRGDVDVRAAILLLQSYLDHAARGGGPAPAP